MNADLMSLLLQQMFDAADSNKDDSISLEEYMKIMQDVPDTTHK